MTSTTTSSTSMTTPSTTQSSTSTSTSTTTSMSTTTSTSTTTTTTTTIAPRCNMMYECEKNSSYFDLNGDLDDKLLLDGKVYSICNRTMFFSTVELTWMEAVTQCCQMDMRLIALDESSKHRCLAEFVNSNPGAFARTNYNLVGASDRVNEGAFEWCTSDLPANVSSAIINWKNGQPDNLNKEEHCANIAASNGIVPDNILLSDLTCDKTKMNYLCESRDEQICIAPECPKLECAVDPVKGAESKLWNSQNGFFGMGCSRQYFISKDSKTRDEAAAECCKYGLQLATFESFYELECFADMNNFETKNSGKYWTFGSNEGRGCEPYHGWCPSKLPFNSSFWKSAFPNDIFTKRCIAFEFSRSAVTNYKFEDALCSQVLPFVCEGDVPDCKASCPNNCTGIIGSDLLNKQGELVHDSHSYGKWIVTSDTSYMFSKTTSTTWMQAYDACCKLGMSLLSLETENEMLALKQYNQNYTELQHVGYHWTGGSQLGCTWRPQWCDSDIKFYRNSSLWEPGQPNMLANKQYCVYFNIDSVGLNDMDCSNAYSYICEKKNTNAPCQSVTCKDLDCMPDVICSCVNNFGQFWSGCGRQYFVSSDQLNQQDAAEECCKYGLRLLSIETLDELNCLAEMNSLFLKRTMEVWTSGTNDGIGCLRKHGWCPSGEFISPDIKFGSGEGFLNAVNENGLLLYYSPQPASMSYLKDISTSARYNYICEGDVQTECQPTCPIVTETCNKNDNLFLNGKLIDSSSYGIWKDTCNRSYMFSHGIATYENSWKTCCSIGMNLLSVETQAEMDCLHTLNIDQLRLSSQFRTSASTKDCPFVFEWCGTGARMYKNDTRWEPPGEPNNNGGNQMCAYLNLGLGAPGSTNFWDLTCDTANPYICEGEI